MDAYAVLANRRKKLQHQNPLSFKSLPGLGASSPEVPATEDGEDDHEELEEAHGHDDKGDGVLVHL